MGRGRKKSLDEYCLPPCRVCEEASTGLHYGVPTCTACKGFFRRSILREDPYLCLESKLCQVGPTIKRRDTCPKCRYEKCIRVGMSVEGIIVGRYPRADKAKYRTERLKKQREQEQLDDDEGKLETFSQTEPSSSGVAEDELIASSTTSESFKPKEFHLVSSEADAKDGDDDDIFLSFINTDEEFDLTFDEDTFTDVFDDEGDVDDVEEHNTSLTKPFSKTQQVPIQSSAISTSRVRETTSHDNKMASIQNVPHRLPGLAPHGVIQVMPVPPTAIIPLIQPHHHRANTISQTTSLRGRPTTNDSRSQFINEHHHHHQQLITLYPLNHPMYSLNKANTISHTNSLRGQPTTNDSRSQFINEHHHPHQQLIALYPPNHPMYSLNDNKTQHNQFYNVSTPQPLFKPQPQAHTNQIQSSFKPQHQPQTNQIQWSFKPQPQTNQPISSFKPQPQPQTNQIQSSFKPQHQPQTNQIQWSFKSQPQPQTNQPISSFKPQPQPQANQPPLFKPQPQPQANQPPLFKPQTQPQHQPQETKFQPDLFSNQDPTTDQRAQPSLRSAAITHHDNIVINLRTEYNPSAIKTEACISSLSDSSCVNFDNYTEASGTFDQHVKTPSPLVDIKPIYSDNALNGPFCDNESMDQYLKCSDKSENDPCTGADTTYQCNVDRVPTMLTADSIHGENDEKKSMADLMDDKKLISKLIDDDITDLDSSTVAAGDSNISTSCNNKIIAKRSSSVEQGNKIIKHRSLAKLAKCSHTNPKFERYPVNKQNTIDVCHQNSQLMLYKKPDILKFALSVFDRFALDCIEKKALEPLLEDCHELPDNIRELLLCPYYSSQHRQGPNTKEDCESNRVMSHVSKTLLPDKSGDDCQYKFPDASLVYDQNEMDHVFDKLLLKHDRYFGHKSTYMTQSDFKMAHEAYYGLCQLFHMIYGEINYINDEKYFKILKETGKDVDNRQKFLLFYADIIEKRFIQDIKFFRSIPGFRDLTMDDRMMLLRSCLFLLAYVSTYKGNDMKNKLCISEEKGVAFRMDILSLKLLPLTDAFNKEMSDIHAAMLNLDLSHEELIVLKALMITFPFPHDALEEPEHVLKCHENYHKCMLNLLRHHYPPDEADCRYSKLMTVFQQINSWRKYLGDFLMQTSNMYASLAEGHDLPLWKSLFIFD